MAVANKSGGLTLVIVIVIIFCASIYIYPLFVTHTIPETLTILPAPTILPIPTISITPTTLPTILPPTILVTPTILPTILPTPTLIKPATLEHGLLTKSFNYIMRGKSGCITIDLYSGVYDNISIQPTPSACMRRIYDDSPCTTSELQQYYIKYINNPIQIKYLTELIRNIKSKTLDKDDQVRIAISLVQNIPYEDTNPDKIILPYEVLYKNKGVCSEKSLLLAYLIKELGYGVVLFEFDSENHMAIGIKSPNQYSYKNSGYAFVETTNPTIPTDSEGTYVIAGKLTSEPQIFQISNGSSFLSISDEYNDSVAFNQLGESGKILDPEKYREWEILIWKYGLILSDGTKITENPSDKPICDNSSILCNANCWEPCYMRWECTSEGLVCYY